MAPASSPEDSRARFSSGLCSNSMAPTPPASRFSFDTRPHLQRLLQSSASPNEESSFQIEQQVRQFYLPQGRPERTVGTASVASGASNNIETMVTDLPNDPSQLGESLQPYINGCAPGGAAILPTLMRYHSAPSSILASLTGMGNTIMNPNSELGQFLSSNVLAGMKDEMDASRADPSHNHIENGAMTATNSHCNGFVRPHAPYQRLSNGELLSQMSMDGEDVPLIGSLHGLPAVGKAALHSPSSSYNQKDAFMHSNTYLENGNKIAHGVALAKESLLRHSSSPAGFLSQLNDEHERGMLGSSSGNSSEEGSYERQGGQGFQGSYAWDDAGITTAVPSDGSSVARKRIRDLAEKGYAGPTLMDPQKALGNYFGPTTASSSPESTYFTEKLLSDSTPCRARARRGFATHPRSIAERVRRTKISERMKKLQDLVPNVDKQANTAEMLDEMVDYVKSLQRQVQELTENQSKCTCACGRAKEAPSSLK